MAAVPSSPAPPAPSPHRSTAFLLVLALAYAGGVTGYLPLLSLLLPIEVEAVAGDARLGVFTATVVAGALAASVANILFGWLSDRTAARGGGRRGWLAAGLVGLAVSYAAIAAAASPLALVLAVVAFQVAVNAVLAPLLAIMAEEVPDAQKGVAGGLLALGSPVASALGAALLAVDLGGATARFAVIPVAAAALALPLLLTSRRVVAGTAPPVPPRIGRRYFAYAWTARMLVQIAGSALSLYLLYYFESIAPAVDPRALGIRVGTILLIASVAPLPVAVLAGRLSDRSGHRRPFLFAAASVAALGLVGMAVAASWTAGAVAFGLYSVGSSVFLALHAGFAMQLLPNPRHRGRDLGLLNLSNTLPALLGPLLIWALATPSDFGPVMIALAALTLGGGVVVLGARSGVVGVTPASPSA